MAASLRPGWPRPQGTQRALKGGWDTMMVCLAGTAGLGGVAHYSCLVATQSIVLPTSQGNCHVLMTSRHSGHNAPCTACCRLQGARLAKAVQCRANNMLCGTKLPMNINTASCCHERGIQNLVQLLHTIHSLGNNPPNTSLRQTTLKVGSNHDSYSMMCQVAATSQVDVSQPLLGSHWSVEHPPACVTGEGDPNPG